MKQYVTSLLLGGVLVSFALSAHAQGLCSAGAATGGISVNDMTYSPNFPPTLGSAATDCYGVVSGNLNPTQETSLANTGIFNSATYGTGTWQFLVKDESNADDGGPGTGSFMGINFTLTASTFSDNDGTWTLTGVDSNGASPLNLPTSLDFIGVLKGSTDLAMYFFNDVTFDGSGGGSWTIVFPGAGQGSNPPPNLSHLDLLVRLGNGGGGGGGTVPEPASLALLGAGLLGVVAARRRRKS